MVTPLYNTSNITKANMTLYDIVNTVNNWSEGVFGLGIVILVFVAVYTLSHKEAPETRLYAASIVTFTITSVLRILGFVNNMILWICLALLGIAAAVFYIKTED